MTVVGRALVGVGILAETSGGLPVTGREGEIEHHPIQKRNIIVQTPSFFRYYATFDRYMHIQGATWNFTK